MVTAVAVAAVVDAAARRREQARVAEHEAHTLAMLNRQVLGGEYDVPRLLALARDTFGADTAELVPDEPPAAAGTVVVPAGAGGWLVLRGAELGTRERSVAAAFASHVGVLREREELARQSMAAAAARGRQPHPDGPARGGLPRPADAAGRAALGRRDAARARPAPRRRPSARSCWRRWRARSRG